MRCLRYSVVVEPQIGEHAIYLDAVSFDVENLVGGLRAFERGLVPRFVAGLF
ncbi:hypothetical protein [Rhodococcus erythropolis]